jgi:two-component system, response regulator RegA
MTSTEQPLRYLLVDDDAPFRAALANAFRRRGHEVCDVASPQEALELCERWVPERAVIDLRMPQSSGIDLLRDLLKRHPEIEAVVLTGYGSIPTAIEAVKRGAVNYLTKPAEPSEIEAAFDDTSFRDPHSDDTVPTVDRAAWEHIQRVLTESQGNVSETARRLGMHRRTLQRKLQKLPPKR